MRDYSVITPAFWIGETGKLLRGDANAQVLSLYLMSSPHSTMTGVFHCPILYMAHETGMSIEGATKALDRLLEVGFCEYDHHSECVFVVRMASYQIAETLKPGDNRVAGLKKELSKMAPALLKARFIATYSVAFCLETDEDFISPYEAPTKPRTGTGTRTGTGIPPKSPKGDDGRFESFWSAYPKKVGKDAGRKAFEKRKVGDELLETMLAAIATQSKSPTWTKDGGQFIPNPATWLNDGRWMDDGAPSKISDDWFVKAGFDNEHEARNFGCSPSTANQFIDGKRIKVAA